MSEIPQIDSVKELANFWDTHDLTDFEGQLVEVDGVVFDRAGRNVVRVRLDPQEADMLHRIALSKGMDDTELVRQWVNEKLHAS